MDFWVTEPNCKTNNPWLINTALYCKKMGGNGAIACVLNVFFYVGPPKETIFLTTIYGLYFSHHYVNVMKSWSRTQACLIFCSPCLLDKVQNLVWYDFSLNPSLFSHIRTISLFLWYENVTRYRQFTLVYLFVITRLP